MDVQRTVTLRDDRWLGIRGTGRLVREHAVGLRHQQATLGEVDGPGVGGQCSITLDADAQADAAKSSAHGSSAKAAVGSERVLQEKMAACGIVAIAAIRDQDDFSLDMVQTGALQKAREVVEEFSSDTYEEGKSDFTDNVIRLLRFLNEFLNA